LKNVNFANVRSAAIAAMLALALAAAPQPAIAASERPARVVIAVLPPTTTVEQIGSVPGVAPGVVSSGIGDVPPAQTYLDISQGNRTNPSLYGSELPHLRIAAGRVPPDLWAEVTARAEDAPADIVPGLLASALTERGMHVFAVPRAGLGQLIVVDREGVVDRATGPRPAVGVYGATVDELSGMAASQRPGDLLIAIAAPDGERALLPAGIVGSGFEGDLTSDSTRSDGLVLSTDIAPTVLDRLGVDVPDEMSGSAIRAEGEPDAAGVAERADRWTDGPSRDLVVLLPLAVWTLIAGLVALLGRKSARRRALRLFALMVVWAPFVMLVVAALDAGETASALAVGLGSPALAAATERAFGGYFGLAVACAVTVAAYALDVVVGSPYSSFSVLGPDPGYGVRFFGIGNELEAILTTLTLVGTGAWLATRGALERRVAAGWFVATAVIAAAAFAPGRFGADVGAAIVLAAGGATAASLSLGLTVRRTVAAVIAAGVVGVLALVAVDELFGGAHFSRTVLGAGEATALGDVFERRLDLMVHTFTDPVYPELLALTALVLIAGLARSVTILSWFGDRWPARCAYLGALVGVLIGTVANDSGSVLLVIGTVYLAAVAAFAWAARPDAG
jgi:hypothetical protein